MKQGEPGYAVGWMSRFFEDLVVADRTKEAFVNKAEVDYPTTPSDLSGIIYYMASVPQKAKPLSTGAS